MYIKRGFRRSISAHPSSRVYQSSLESRSQRTERPCTQVAPQKSQKEEGKRPKMRSGFLPLHQGVASRAPVASPTDRTRNDGNPPGLRAALGVYLLDRSAKQIAPASDQTKTAKLSDRRKALGVYLIDRSAKYTSTRQSPQPTKSAEYEKGFLTLAFCMRLPG